MFDFPKTLCELNDTVFSQFTPACSAWCYSHKVFLYKSINLNMYTWRSCQVCVPYFFFYISIYNVDTIFKPLCLLTIYLGYSYFNSSAIYSRLGSPCIVWRATIGAIILYMHAYVLFLISEVLLLLVQICKFLNIHINNSKKIADYFYHKFLKVCFKGS